MKNLFIIELGFVAIILLAACTGSKERNISDEAPKLPLERIAANTEASRDSQVYTFYSREIVDKIASIDTLQAVHVNPFRRPKGDEVSYGDFVVLNRFSLENNRTKLFTEGLLSDTLCSLQNDTITKLCLFRPEYIVNSPNGLIFEISPGCRQIMLKEVVKDSVHKRRSIDYEDDFAQVIDSIFVQP